jgi:glycosyltransferase involved in cell wall biosynthesis
MNDSPLVSIAMATYNGQQYLREQLDSIYAQTYPNIEVIVCDDCSTDDTVRILEAYRDSKGLRFSINEKNLGFVKNFERVIAMCSGEYIALADQDDIWMPKKLETLLDKICGYSLACSDAVLIDGEGRRFADSFIRYAGNEPGRAKEGNPFVRLLFGNFVTGCTTLMHRDVIEKAHPIPKGVRYHDWWYAVIASTLRGVVFTPEALVCYRQHARNDTGAKRKHSVPIQFLSQLNPFHHQIRASDEDEALNRLNAYLRSGRFSVKESGLIEDVIAYFQDRREGLIHFRAFLLAVKYRKERFPDVRLIMQYLKCFRSLF